MSHALALDFRTDSSGNKTLYFPLIAISDIHWGTRQCRAKLLCQILGHTDQDRLYLIGDIVDGEHMRVKKKWNFAPAHGHGIAHVCRKADEGTRVTYIPGNHDEDIRNKKILDKGIEKHYRNLCGKSVYGIDIAERAYYTDPKGRRLLLIHGDQYDDSLFGHSKGFWYAIGDFLYDGFVYIDTHFQRVPRCDGISIAAVVKRLTKTIINQFLGVRHEITKTIDENPQIDGIIYGHSHMAEISYTPAGKLMLNDGCCTEYVQMLVHDAQGTWGIVTCSKYSLSIRDEHGFNKSYSWKELGIDLYGDAGEAPDEKYAGQSARLIRLFYRMWQPLDRDAVRQAQAPESSTAYIPLPDPRRPHKPAGQPGSTVPAPRRPLPLQPAPAKAYA